MKLLKMGRNLLSTVASASVTSGYPEIPSHIIDEAHESIEIEAISCTLCGVCERRCPASAISISRDEQKWFIDRMKCLACGECRDVCPEKCLTLVKEYVAPSANVVIDVYGASALPGSDAILESIEKCPLMIEEEFPEELKANMINMRDRQHFRKRSHKSNKKQNKRKYRNKRIK